MQQEGAGSYLHMGYLSFSTDRRLLGRHCYYCMITGAEECSKRLVAAGFVRLNERSQWKLEAGGRYFFTRNASSLVAFAVGAKYQPGCGFHLIGAHTDRCISRTHLSCILSKQRSVAIILSSFGSGWTLSMRNYTQTAPRGCLAVKSEHNFVL